MHYNLEQAKIQLELQGRMATSQIRKLESSMQELGESWGDRSLHRQIEERLDRITQAKERLQNGTYGLCQSCGAPIPAERLETIPETTTCVRCTQSSLRSHVRSLRQTKHHYHTHKEGSYAA